jgi:hypothetical protein
MSASLGARVIKGNRPIFLWWNVSTVQEGQSTWSGEAYLHALHCGDWRGLRATSVYSLWRRMGSARGVDCRRVLRGGVHSGARGCVGGDTVTRVLRFGERSQVPAGQAVQ